MPSWNQVTAQIQAVPSPHDNVRRDYLRQLHDLTGRNVIVYYSGWLEKQQLLAQGLQGVEVNDSDKNGFMATIHELDRSKGLDLIVHTPGGDVAATESVVDYLRAMFDTDIRVIVPHLAMSAGTMIALAAKSVLMGKHSSLGPIDPQIGGLPAHGIKEEFDRAIREISADPSRLHVWQPIIAKYSPTLIGECEKAIDWANKMVKAWLESGMFEGEPDASARADRVLSELADHALTLSHARHISAQKAMDLGINVDMLEKDQELQEAVLSVHHACVQTVAETPAFKIIENHNGVAFISSAAVSHT
jgi:membrane-bound ClpP family serine protease